MEEEHEVLPRARIFFNEVQSQVVQGLQPAHVENLLQFFGPPDRTDGWPVLTTFPMGDPVLTTFPIVRVELEIEC